MTTSTSNPDSKYRSSWSLPGSAERNSQPIARALSPLLSPAATSSSSSSSRKPVILEVASGFGHQIHAVASEYPHCRFHPSEADAYLRDEINTRTAGLPNVVKAESLVKVTGEHSYTTWQEKQNLQKKKDCLMG